MREARRERQWKKRNQGTAQPQRTQRPRLRDIADAGQERAVSVELLERAHLADALRQGTAQARRVQVPAHARPISRTLGFATVGCELLLTKCSTSSVF